MHGTAKPFVVSSTVRDQLIMNDGHAQETLKALVKLMATDGTIFRQGDGDAQRGVIIRAISDAEIRAMKAKGIEVPAGLLLPARVTVSDIQDFAEQRFDVIKHCKKPKSDDYENRPADFRPAVAQRLIEARLHHMRCLRGVTYAPIMRGDGTIIVTHGYNPETQLWVVNDLPAITIPDAPTCQDATAALDILKTLVADHPFETDVDRIAAIAIQMVTTLRASMQRAPLLVADAAYPRTGKDYLLGTGALIGTGFLPVIVSMGDSYDEQKKRIGWALLCGAPSVTLCNINGRFGSDEVAPYLTEGGCVTRNYGTTGGAKFAPNGNTLNASGNNIILGGDLPERSLIARQDANMDNPGVRTFTHSPHQDVRGDRSRFLNAIFTIARWAVRGTDYTSPQVGGFSGFDDFNRLIRGPLLALTTTDPLQRSQGEMQTNRQDQPGRDLVDALTSLLNHSNPFCTGDIGAELKKQYIIPGDPDPYAILREKNLPYRLRRARGRRGATMQLVSVERPKGGADVAWYQLNPLTPATNPPPQNPMPPATTNDLGVAP